MRETNLLGGIYWPREIVYQQMLLRVQCLISNIYFSIIFTKNEKGFHIIRYFRMTKHVHPTIGLRLGEPSSGTLLRCLASIIQFCQQPICKIFLINKINLISICQRINPITAFYNDWKNLLKYFLDTNLYKLDVYTWWKSISEISIKTITYETKNTK